jgi:hypothetical protein
MREWAAKAFPHVEVDFETDKFRDHWLANGEAKLDWAATWRNWIRRSRTEYGPGGRGPRAGARSESRPADRRDPERLARDNRERANKALANIYGEGRRHDGDDEG